MKKLLNLPSRPGVYLFKNKKGEILYVGKAINVKKRVSSYFQKNLVLGKTSILVSRTDKIDTINVTSELEALLLEAELIKKHKPFFNSRAKDDKHPLYIKVTVKDPYPRIFLVRHEEEPGSLYFGPFPATSTVKQVLVMLRNIFPFDTQKTIGKKPCFWSHIGLCNPCPSRIQTLPEEVKRSERAKYRRNLKNILSILSRKSGKVREDLVKDMAQLASREMFEEAQVLRDQIKRLDYITQPYNRVSSFLENPNLVTDIRQEETKALSQLLFEHKILGSHPRGRKLKRIECFDASHTAIVSPTVGMVTFVNGEPDKSLYRRFKVKREASRDDLSFLEECLTRRFSRKDWGYPDLVVIDGGKTQVGRAQKVLKLLNIRIPVIGLVKPFDDVVILHKDGFQIVRLRGGPAQRLLQRLRDEAHRFSRAYHFNLRSKRLMGHA